MHWSAQAEKLLILGCVCVFSFLQETIISHLHKRYDELQVYTYVGDILIALNPFQNLSIYSPQVGNTSVTNGFCVFLQTQWKWWMDASHDAGSALVDTVFVGLVIVIIIILFLFTVTVTIMAIVILVSATIWPPNFLLSQFKSTIFNLLNYSKHL